MILLHVRAVLCFRVSTDYLSSILIVELYAYLHLVTTASLSAAKQAEAPWASGHDGRSTSIEMSKNRTLHNLRPRLSEFEQQRLILILPKREVVNVAFMASASACTLFLEAGGQPGYGGPRVAWATTRRRKY